MSLYTFVKLANEYLAERGQERLFYNYMVTLSRKPSPDVIPGEVNWTEIQRYLTRRFGEKECYALMETIHNREEVRRTEATVTWADALRTRLSHTSLPQSTLCDILQLAEQQKGDAPETLLEAFKGLRDKGNLHQKIAVRDAIIYVLELRPSID